MMYLGGKTLIAKEIAAFLSSLRAPGQTYIEPFLGSAAVFHRMSEDKVGCDAHPDLMMMWRALQSGWEPPDSVTEEEYEHLRSATPSALRGFVGFGCSYSGKWFAGYARNRRGDDYVGAAKRSVLRRVRDLQESSLVCMDYLDLQWRGALIYCDPPYAGTTSYSSHLRFDSEEFWDKARSLSRDNLVLVSEFSAPPDFTTVWEKERVPCMRYRDPARTRPTEKLFVLL